MGGVDTFVGIIAATTVNQETLNVWLNVETVARGVEEGKWRRRVVEECTQQQGLSKRTGDS